jgi:hypothetical protein
MLLPQFSIRTLLGLTAVAGLVSLILQQAVAGALWAQCAGWTLLFLAALFACYAGLFLVAYLTGKLLGAIWPTAGRSPGGGVRPFASDVVGANPFAATAPEPLLENPSP